MTAGAAAVSIALATYNGERFLAEQLDSLAAQTLLPAELVVTDDRSTDATATLLQDFAARAPFPVHVHVNPERLGYRRNFRRAAKLCRGELISFSDQDDIWLPGKLATIVPAFADPGLLLAYHNVRLMDGEGRLLDARLYDQGVEQAALQQRPMPPWHFSFGLTQTFRASMRAHDDLWDRSLDHLQDEILAHDQWYMFLALALGRVAYVDQDLIHYRQHGGNAYGSAGVRTRWQRLLDRFGHDAEGDRMAGASAASKAEIVRQIALREGRDLGAVSGHYDRLAQRMRRRHATYTGSGAIGRLAGLARSMASGDYCGNPWGFDWKSIPRDVVTGVVRGGAH